MLPDYSLNFSFILFETPFNPVRRPSFLGSMAKFLFCHVCTPHYTSRQIKTVKIVSFVDSVLNLQYVSSQHLKAEAFFPPQPPLNPPSPLNAKSLTYYQIKKRRVNRGAGVGGANSQCRLHNYFPLRNKDIEFHIILGVKYKTFSQLL